MRFKLLTGFISIGLATHLFASPQFKTANNIPTQIPEKLLSFLPKSRSSKPLNSKHKKISRVIYITLDGVRWQDIFQDKSHLPTFWRKYANQMEIYGEPGSERKMEVASVPTSLPSYQSQMSGAVQPCKDNLCGRIGVETMPENLMHHFGLKRRDVAAFASWFEIDYAVEHEFGTALNNAGNKPVVDPETGQPDPVMLFLNEQQNIYNADFVDRFDVFTFAQAMHYLEAYKPKFLWISLTDADVSAHLKILKLYHAILSLYDRMLDIFFSTLDVLDLSDETMVIITTDHGRGNGSHWSDHGPNYPESKQTWAFVKNGALVPASDPNYYSTLSIRPTIENVFVQNVEKA